MDKATPTPSPASVDKQAALVAKLRYMGKQYAAGQVARGGSPQKHYLEEAADEIEMMAWALSMNEKTPASAQENADLRNVIQGACIDGLPGLARAWEKYFPDHPISIKGIEQRAGAAPGADGWIAIPEGGMPPLGEQVLVWCKFGPHWGPMVDCWDEQHEAPLSFSSETIPIGPGWDSGSDFYDVTHWKPIGAPVAVQHPQQEQPK